MQLKQKRIYHKSSTKNNTSHLNNQQNPKKNEFLCYVLLSKITTARLSFSLKLLQKVYP